MYLVLEKFVEFFDDIYGDREQKFYEEDGRRYFMLYLRHISMVRETIILNPEPETANERI